MSSYVRKSNFINVVELQKAIPSRKPFTAADKMRVASMTAGNAPQINREGRAKNGGPPCPSCGQHHEAGTICGNKSLNKGNDYRDGASGKFSFKEGGVHSPVSAHAGGRPRKDTMATNPAIPSAIADATQVQASPFDPTRIAPHPPGAQMPPPVPTPKDIQLDVSKDKIRREGKSKNLSLPSPVPAPASTLEELRQTPKHESSSYNPTFTVPSPPVTSASHQVSPSSLQPRPATNLTSTSPGPTVSGEIPAPKKLGSQQSSGITQGYRAVSGMLPSPQQAQSVGSQAYDPGAGFQTTASTLTNKLHGLLGNTNKLMPQNTKQPTKMPAAVADHTNHLNNLSRWASNPGMGPKQPEFPKPIAPTVNQQFKGPKTINEMKSPLNVGQTSIDTNHGIPGFEHLPQSFKDVFQGNKSPTIENTARSNNFVQDANISGMEAKRSKGNALKDWAAKRSARQAENSSVPKIKDPGTLSSPESKPAMSVGQFQSMQTPKAPSSVSNPTVNAKFKGPKTNG